MIGILWNARFSERAVSAFNHCAIYPETWKFLLFDFILLVLRTEPRTSVLFIVYCCDKTLWPKELGKDSIYLGLLFPKSPSWRSKHTTAGRAKNSCVDPQGGGRESTLETASFFWNLKVHLRNTPSTRPYLLIFPKQFYMLGTDFNNHGLIHIRHVPVLFQSMRH